MDKIFEAFGEALKGLPISIFVVLLFCVIIFYFFKDGITTWLKREVKAVKKVKKLEYHRFFNVCDDMEGKIKNMKFYTDGKIDTAKTKIMHKLIELKVCSMKNKFKELLNTNGIDDWDVYQLNYEVKKTLSEVVKDYNSKCELELIKWGVSEKDAKYIIQEYEDYRMTIVEGFIDSIDSIISNPDYINNFDKVNTTLELCALATSVIPRDVRSVFEAVNGRFKNYDI